MGAYKYIKETDQRELKDRSDYYKQKLIGWGAGPAVERVERPSNLARARTLGYKAKTGYAVVRVRMGKGRRRRPTVRMGRHPGHSYVYVQPGLSHQAMAEQKANRVYKNMEVLNSYFIGEDGNHKFFEVILVDQSMPQVGLHLPKGRSFRGLTSRGRKVRGLRATGKKSQRPGPKRK
ncbi:MAG: 50S ribosomal protein L15e [Candidatus ainarchaeum sp.]|nr:50S ribosomal protein L15e [Candidatus ainarchaeum sp.]